MKRRGAGSPSTSPKCPRNSAGNSRASYPNHPSRPECRGMTMLSDSRRLSGARLSRAIPGSFFHLWYLRQRAELAASRDDRGVLVGDWPVRRIGRHWMALVRGRALGHTKLDLSACSEMDSSATGLRLRFDDGYTGSPSQFAPRFPSSALRGKDHHAEGMPSAQRVPRVRDVL